MLFNRKKYKALEKKVIEQDLLAKIIYLTNAKEPFVYKIIVNSPFHEPIEKVYEITAKEIK